jgi:hypothetical protein
MGSGSRFSVRAADRWASDKGDLRGGGISSMRCAEEGGGRDCYEPSLVYRAGHMRTPLDQVGAIVGTQLSAHTNYCSGSERAMT